MFVTTARRLVVLRDLGISSDRLNGQRSVFITGDGILHSGTRQVCQVGPSADRTIRLLDDAERLCPLCTGDLADRVLGRELRTLFEIAEFAARTDVPGDVLQVRDLLRRCATMFDWLHANQDDEEACGNALRLLGVRYEQLKAALRAPEAVERIRSVVLPAGMAEDRSPVLAGVRGYNPHRNPDVIGDLIVASCWVGMVRGGHFVLSTTADVAAVLAGRVMPAGTRVDAVVPVPAERAATLAETVSRLWQPADEENLTGFAETVEIARTVLQL